MGNNDGDGVSLRKVLTWQPIEGAPKDGTPVLVWDSWEDRGEGVAAFDEGYWRWSKAAVCDEYPTNGPISPSHWKELGDPPYHLKTKVTNER